MAVASELQSLLDALYDAAVDPARWTAFLNHLTRALSGESAALVLHNVENVSSSVAEQVGLSSEGTLLYAQHYYKLDVWTAKGRESEKSVLTTTSEQLCPWSEFRRTEYYNDFLRPHGIAHGIFFLVKSSDSDVTSLSIYRGRKGEFSDIDLEILEFLAPHVRRAFRVHSQIGRLRSVANCWHAALNAISTPMFLLGRSSRVIGMNDAAVSLVSKKDGLLITRSGISAERSSESHQLRHIIKAATAESSNASKSAAVKVSRRSGSPLNLLISPAPDYVEPESDRKVIALLFVTDPDQPPLPAPAVLKMLYGLTSAESRLTLHLANGQDLRGICDEFSITYATARAHLRNIFQKLGIRRQAELASLVLPLASPSSRQH
jgi:DNA-binding CsgD family transcriptional regulator